MIKTPLLLFYLLFVYASYGQLKMNQWTVGGTMSYSHSHDENNLAGLNSETNAHTLNLAPGFGYFAMDRLSVGMRFQFLDSKSKNKQEGVNPILTAYTNLEIVNSGFGISPYVRYYVLPQKTNWNLFGEFSYLHINQTTKSTITQVAIPAGGGLSGGSASSSSTKNKTNRNLYTLAAGPAFFISPHVSVELSIGYSIGKTNEENHTFNQLALGTGFQVFFGGKK
jgi:hypothetical protein